MSNPTPLSRTKYVVPERSGAPASAVPISTLAPFFFAAVLDRVRQQVHPHLLEQHPVAPCWAQIADDDFGSRRVGACPDFGESLFDSLGHISACGLDGLAPQPRERQQVIDELPHLPAVVANDLQQPAALVVELVPIILLEDASEAVYRPQRRAQVVRDRVAEAFQLLVRRLELV